MLLTKAVLHSHMLYEIKKLLRSRKSKNIKRFYISRYIVKLRVDRLLSDNTV